jgi:hypothetical protein
LAFTTAAYVHTYSQLKHSPFSRINENAKRPSLPSFFRYLRLKMLHLLKLTLPDRVDTELLLVCSYAHRSEVSIGWQSVASQKGWKDRKLPPDAGKLEEPYIFLCLRATGETKKLTLPL